MNGTHKRSNLGQGMTEYIIILALLAVGAIAAYTFFGDTVRGQVGTIAGELGGQDTSATVTSTTTSASDAATEGTEQYDLDSYSEGAER